MANVITSNFSFTLPEVGADTNAWGGHLNGNFQTIDDQMVSRTKLTLQTFSGAIALPSNGLNVGSGQLNVTGGNVSMSGGLTVTGQVTASAAPSAGSSLTNKTYVDAADNLRLLLAGGTMTGLLTLSGAPTVALHAATKGYADGLKTTIDAYTVTGTGGLTGGGAINGNPSISIAAGGVGATQLATDAVTTAKILNGNVTNAKLAEPFTAMTATAASGTSVNFGSIPSWVKRITIIYTNIAFALSDALQVQIGPSGGVETTGYTTYSYTLNGASASSSTTAFAFNMTTTSAFSGRITIETLGSNIWVAHGSAGGNAPTNISLLQSSKTLAGTLTQLTLSGVSSRSFSTGTFQVFYE